MTLGKGRGRSVLVVTKISHVRAEEEDQKVPQGWEKDLKDHQRPVLRTLDELGH